MNLLLQEHSFLELSIIDSIRHVNKISLLDLSCQLKSLADVLKTRDKKYEKLYPIWAKQLISVISILHENKIIHTDIRPENIFITDDLNLKLGGFTKARLIINSKDKYNIKPICSKNYDPNIDKFGRELDTYWWMNDTKPASDTLLYPTRFKTPIYEALQQVKTRIDIEFGDSLYRPPEFVCLGSQEWSKQDLKLLYKYDIWSAGLTLLDILNYRYRNNSGKFGIHFHKNIPRNIDSFKRNLDRINRTFPDLDPTIKSMLQINPDSRPEAKRIIAYGNLIPGYKLAYIKDDSVMLQTNMNIISTVKKNCEIIVTEDIFGSSVNSQAIEIACRLLSNSNIKAKCISEDIVKFAYETSQALYYTDPVRSNDILEDFGFNFI